MSYVQHKPSKSDYGFPLSNVIKWWKTEQKHCKISSQFSWTVTLLVCFIYFLSIRYLYPSFFLITLDWRAITFFNWFCISKLFSSLWIHIFQIRQSYFSTVFSFIMHSFSIIVIILFYIWTDMANNVFFFTFSYTGYHS